MEENLGTAEKRRLEIARKLAFDDLNQQVILRHH